MVKEYHAHVHKRNRNSSFGKVSYQFIVLPAFYSFLTVYALLTHCIHLASSTVIRVCWTSPLVILGVLGLFCHFILKILGIPMDIFSRQCLNTDYRFK